MRTHAEVLQELKKTAEYKYQVASTYRNGKGAVGGKSLVVKYVEEIADPLDYILDFGCGYDGIYVQEFHKKGYASVYGYDVVLDEKLLDLPFKTFSNDLYGAFGISYTHWDIIYASNVLNVQPSEEHLEAVIQILAGLCSNNTILVVNYPSDPRKSGVDAKGVKEMLNQKFTVGVVGKNVYFCRKRKICRH